MSYSSALGQSYLYYPNLDQLMFEDGVCYTTEEAVIVSKVKKPADIRVIHNVKKIFGGLILRPENVSEDDSGFCCVPPVTESDPTPPPKRKKKIEPDAEVLSFL
jgi:hypothetical protein